MQLAGQTPEPPAAAVSFNRDVRPIMSGTCFRCHGPDESSRRAGMRLDLRDEALKRRGNGTPIVPGKPDESLIVRRIFAEDPARVMPPADVHKELTDAQKQTIRRWIEQGAVYEGQWSYQPVVRPAVPAVAAARHPIDAFVQARLDAEGVKKSPEADRRTLLRRVTLDLTGLAPTASESAAFLADRSPDAYEKVVDRLMASPRYAEKQAIEWLDAVRYADTAGFHGDNPYPVWPYRDWVLNAIRDNKPFDAFTREQLAGDLLPGATRGSADRLRLQPPEPRVGRGRPAGEGIPREVRRRPRPHGQHGLDGQHARLRRMPRPQVRPVQGEGLLRDEGVLRRHQRARAWRATATAATAPTRGA